jgi:excinuclease ABC subunit A
MIKRSNYPENIEIRGARVHNLKDVSLSVPLGELVAIAGVSGSGKSSLAMGVLYAEGSRRYLEALSAYTRRRISRSAAAKVDSIENIPAAVALHQRPAVPGVRSTFGTSTELLNSLRLMYSRLGSHMCPNGHLTPPSINVAAGRELVCPECGAHFDPPGAESFSFNGGGSCPNCSGTGTVREIDNDKLVPDRSRTLEEGAVEAWNMFGISWMYRVAAELGVRTDVPFEELTEREKEIVYEGEEVKRVIMIPSKNGKLFELNCTYRNARRAVGEALDRAVTEKGLERIDKYLSVHRCPSCGGSRLSESARSSRLFGKSLDEVSAMTLDSLTEWIKDVPRSASPEMRGMAESIAAEFVSVADRVRRLGLGYLSLDRPSFTLSTGERQRVQLAKSLHSNTTGVLYVLDEPSVGLHPSDVDGMLEVVRGLVERGNSVVLVDHDVRILKEADSLIEMGPGAGDRGGRVISCGTAAEVANDPNSVIGRFISGEERVEVRECLPSEEVFNNGRIELKTDQIYTVRPLEIAIPLKRLTAVTGVSGSGKTTLVLESLVPALIAKIAGERLPNHVKYAEAAGIKRVNLIDASPIGANVRSTVATYSNVLDDLRRLYASLPDAKRLGLKSADFSYNTGSLRCVACDGTGQISMDVQFLPDVEIVCPDCGGTRYSKDAESVKKSFGNGERLSLPELMSLTVEEALKKGSCLKRAAARLKTLDSLGLGYLTLGEATPALSGGEAQRLKLAGEIGRTQEGSLFVFDEPTIGLHPCDVRVLIEIFDRLIKNGATVVVIEHDLDMAANSDYIIDMGPRGGAEGGRVVAAGTPAEVAACSESLTGKYLAEAHGFKRNAQGREAAQAN